MPKIRLKSQLLGINKHVVNTIGIINNNKIIYNDSGIKVIINIFENQVNLIRESDEFILDIYFLNNTKTKGIYKMKSINFETETFVKTNFLNINDNGFEIDYEMSIGGEKQNYKFSVEYEVEYGN